MILGRVNSKALTKIPVKNYTSLSNKCLSAYMAGIGYQSAGTKSTLHWGEHVPHPHYYSIIHFAVLCPFSHHSQCCLSCSFPFSAFLSICGWTGGCAPGTVQKKTVQGRESDISVSIEAAPQCLRTLIQTHLTLKAPKEKVEKHGRLGGRLSSRELRMPPPAHPHHFVHFINAVKRARHIS